MSIQRDSRLTSQTCSVCQVLTMEATALADGSELVWCPFCDFEPLVTQSDLQKLSHLWCLCAKCKRSASPGGER